MSRARLHRWVVALALGVGATGRLVAHDLSQSASTIRIDGSTVIADLSINLLAFAGVDANGDGRVSYEELDRGIEPVFASIKAHYLLRSGGTATTVVVEKYDVVEDHLLHIGLRYDFGHRITELGVTSSFHEIAGADHQHIVTAVLGGDSHRDMLTGAHPTTTFYASGFSTGRIVAIAVAGSLLLILALLRIRSRRAA